MEQVAENKETSRIVEGLKNRLPTLSKPEEYILGYSDKVSIKKIVQNRPTPFHVVKYFTGIDGIIRYRYELLFFSEPLLRACSVIVLAGFISFILWYIS
jgi:hypothetical protein